MLRIIVGDEGFNEDTQEFELIDPIVVELEHSLVSVSKWEAEFQVPFLSSLEKTSEEIYGYLKTMIISQGVNPKIVLKFSPEDILQIQNYIDSPQSATTFGMMPDRTAGRGEIITSELIYYWMVAFNIPFECQYWHLNRLFALIRICNIKNSNPKKMSAHEVALRNRELNAKRREQLGTSG